MQPSIEKFLNFYMKPINKERTTISSGNWLKLEKLIYTDSHGVERDWETATRLNAHGAVAVIAILKPSNKIILIRQYRPPANGYVIEFPAGLIDDGESPKITAGRELLEETGYTGKIESILPPSFSSPGLSGEQVYLALMTVDENAFENKILETNFDDGEHVETLTVHLSELDFFLNERFIKGDLMDSKVLTFASASKAFDLCR